MIIIFFVWDTFCAHQIIKVLAENIILSLSYLPMDYWSKTCSYLILSFTKISLYLSSYTWQDLIFIACKTQTGSFLVQPVYHKAVFRKSFMTVVYNQRVQLEANNFWILKLQAVGKLSSLISIIKRDTKSSIFRKKMLVTLYVYLCTVILSQTSLLANYLSFYS